MKKILSIATSSIVGSSATNENELFFSLKWCEALLGFCVEYIKPDRNLIFKLVAIQTKKRVFLNFLLGLSFCSGVFSCDTAF